MGGCQSYYSKPAHELVDCNEEDIQPQPEEEDHDRVEQEEDEGHEEDTPPPAEQNKWVHHEDEEGGNYRISLYIRPITPPPIDNRDWLMIQSAPSRCVIGYMCLYKEAKWPTCRFQCYVCLFRGNNLTHCSLDLYAADPVDKNCKSIFFNPNICIGNQDLERIS